MSLLPLRSSSPASHWCQKAGYEVSQSERLRTFRDEEVEQEAAAVETALLQEHLGRSPNAPLMADAITQAQDGERHSTAPMTARLPRFNGSVQWECFEAQFNMAARHLRWSEGDAALQLGLALEGDALQILLDVPSEEHLNVRALKEALNRRFGRVITAESQRRALIERKRRRGERISVLAVELTTLTRQAYSGFPEMVRQELALDAFFNALTPDKLQEQLRLSAPKSLEEAVREAERIEAILCEPIPDSTVVEPVRRARAVPLVCWRCHVRGHRARECKEPRCKRPVRGEPAHTLAKEHVTGRRGRDDGLLCHCSVKGAEKRECAAPQVSRGKLKHPTSKQREHTTRRATAQSSELTRVKQPPREVLKGVGKRRKRAHKQKGPFVVVHRDCLVTEQRVAEDKYFVVGQRKLSFGRDLTRTSKRPPRVRKRPRRLEDFVSRALKLN